MINRKLAGALVRLAPKELALSEIPIAELPLYSYDCDADFPPPAREFKEALAAVDAFLFVRPEYNRSIPGCLKNAIDWASRPCGQNSFTRLPGPAPHATEDLALGGVPLRETGVGAKRRHGVSLVPDPVTG